MANEVGPLHAGREPCNPGHWLVREWKPFPDLFSRRFGPVPHRSRPGGKKFRRTTGVAPRSKRCRPSRRRPIGPDFTNRRFAAFFSQKTSLDGRGWRHQRRCFSPRAAGSTTRRQQLDHQMRSFAVGALRREPDDAGAREQRWRGGDDRQLAYERGLFAELESKGKRVHARRLRQQPRCRIDDPGCNWN